MQCREPDPTELVSLVQDDVVVNGFVGKKICDLPLSSPVVYSSDGYLALFKPVLEEVIKICTRTKTSIKINTKNYKYAKCRFDKVKLTTWNEK